LKVKTNKQINEQTNKQTNNKQTTKTNNLERFTDFNIEKARQRYAVFKAHFGTLQELKKYFSFTLIDTNAPLEHVRKVLNYDKHNKQKQEKKK
jgi:hypothetical protein